MVNHLAESIITTGRDVFVSVKFFSNRESKADEAQHNISGDLEAFISSHQRLKLLGQCYMLKQDEQYILKLTHEIKQQHSNNDL